MAFFIPTLVCSPISVATKATGRKQRIISMFVRLMGTRVEIDKRNQAELQLIIKDTHVSRGADFRIEVVRGRAFGH